MELPTEVENVEHLRKSIHESRISFISNIVNSENFQNKSFLRDEVDSYLESYERVAEEAVQGGLTLSAIENFPVEVEKWSIMQAIFFASTVLTTIGECFAKVCHLQKKMFVDNTLLLN